ETLEQQTATSNVLKVISGSPTDVMPVFDAIVNSARDLGEAANAYAFRYDGEQLHFITSTDSRPDVVEKLRQNSPFAVDEASMSGRVILSGKALQIADLANEPGYNPRHRSVATSGRLLGVPMLREGVPVGALTVAWPEPGTVPDKF